MIYRLSWHLPVRSLSIQIMISAHSFFLVSASVDFAWITNLVAYYRPAWAPEIRLPFSCRCLTTQLHVAEKFCGIDTRSVNSPLKQHGFPENHFAVQDALRQAWIYLTLKSILREFKANVSFLQYEQRASQVQEEREMTLAESLNPWRPTTNTSLHCNHIMDYAEVLFGGGALSDQICFVENDEQLTI